jgi:NAD(P)-dependent dehydrogenase (short-subunit alcohol dehydrogenase family)
VLDSFEGRVAVITGGGSGIGRELALALCDLGMSLALVDIDQNCLVETAAVLSNPSAVRTYTADVGDREAIEKVAASVFRDLGTPSLLVSNAGLLGPLGKRVWEYANEEWKRVLSVNLYGGINVVRAFLPSMRELTWSSHVVIVASAAGVIPGNRMAPYFASKHAVVAFAENLELELRDEGSGVGVSLVCPGGVRTNLNADARAAGNANSPASEWLEPEDVAKRIIDAVQAGLLYVFTHQSSIERLRRYQEHILAGGAL